MAKESNPTQSDGLVVVVGTIHLLEEARGALRSLLELLRPELITVEISRFSIDYRARNRRIWMERFGLACMRLGIDLDALPPVLELLRRQLSMPYEWRVAQEYGIQHGKRVIPIDTATLSKSELPSWEKGLLSEENLKLLVETSSLKDIREHFGPLKQRALAFLGKDPPPCTTTVHPLSWLEDRFWQDREKTLAKRLLRIGRFCTNVVHIGGWMHCVANSPWKTLVDLLMDAGLRPVVKKGF